MRASGFVRALATAGVIVSLAACGRNTGSTGTASSPTQAVPSGSAALRTAPPPSTLPTPAPSPGSSSPTPAANWPFVLTACAGAGGDPRLLVALGTSETSGWGVLPEESYSPQGAYPALYAEILCKEIGVPVEIHSYFPSSELAPLAWWIDKLTQDQDLRADLAAADLVLLWAMSAHDIVIAQYLPGACGGAWPDPLKTCLLQETAHIPAKTDELFGLVAGLIGDDTIVLAGDAFAPPIATASPDWDAPYAHEVALMVDPYYAVKPAATKHGFILVDTELVFNGETRREAPTDGLFQPDGLHPTAAGQQLAAATYAAADGLGE